MPTYHKGLPAGCPPNEAKAIKGVFFRSIRGSKPSEDDFLSHRENAKKCEFDECSCWGISVWKDLTAVEHAMKLFSFFRRNKVVKVSVGTSDGVLACTPTNKQPGHFTYWCSKETKFPPLCELITVGQGGSNGD
jgi:hypothetical protein